MKDSHKSWIQTILRQRIALIMDDSFVAAFAKCAEDKDPSVRTQTTIIAGTQWVWEAQEQNPEAIELMLKLSKDNVRQVRYNAVYYGLSTTRNKSDDVIRRLLEMAFDDREWNLFHRIEWGLRDDSERVATMLADYINGDNASHAKAAREVFKQLTGREAPVVQNGVPATEARASIQTHTNGVNQIMGRWKIVKLADMPADQLTDASVVIDENHFKMHVPSQKGPHPHLQYTLGADGAIDLREPDDAEGKMISRAKYTLIARTLYVAVNA